MTHNPKVTGSNPVPATKDSLQRPRSATWAFVVVVGVFLRLRRCFSVVPPLWCWAGEQGG